MAILSRTVLSDTGTNWNMVSEPLRAAGWYGRTPGLHTISFTLRNFVGRIYVLATLENSTEAADANNGWFPIYMAGVESVPWVQFPPQDAQNTQPVFPTQRYGTQTTGTFCETFFGNFTFLKAGIDRDYLKDSATNIIDDNDKYAVGKLEQILINF